MGDLTISKATKMGGQNRIVLWQGLFQLGRCAAAQAGVRKAMPGAKRPPLPAAHLRRARPVQPEGQVNDVLDVKRGVGGDL